MPSPVPYEESSASVFRRDHDHDSSGRRDRSYSDAHAILFSKTSSANSHSAHLDPASSTSTVMTSVEALARDNNTITMTVTETGQLEANMKQFVSGSGGGKLHPSSTSSSHHHPQQHGHAAAGRPRSKSLDVHRHHVALPAMHKKKYPNHHHHHNFILRAHHGAQQYLLHHGRNSPETASTTTMKLKGKMWIRPASPIQLFKDHRRQQQQQQHPHHENGMEDNEAEQAILTIDNMMFSSPIYRNHREREPFRMCSSPARRVADFPYSSTDPATTTAVNSFDDEILMYSTTTTSNTTLPKISFTSSSSSSTSPYGDVEFYPTANTTATTRKEDTTRHDSRGDGNGGQLKFSFGESGKLIKPREIPLISTMRS